MDWLLILGLGFLVYGVWFWFQRNKPSSPLLHDDSLHKLYRTLQTLKEDIKHSEANSAVGQTADNRMMLSYIFQDQQLETDTLFVHNISLAIPNKAIKSLGWDLDAQKQLAHFIVNALNIQDRLSVHTTDKAILSINFIFPTTNDHTSFLDRSLSNMDNIDLLKEPRAQFEIHTLETPTDEDLTVQPEERGLSAP